MKFEPKTDKQIAEMNLWPEGNYSFEILEGVDKQSKQLNDMIELKVKVFNDNGGFIFVKDYLLESMAYKLRHAAKVCDLVAQYDSGLLAGMDFAGKCGTLKLKIQKSKDPAYADKNVVGDYIVKKDGDEEVVVNSAAHATAPLKDDSIPF